MPDERNISLLTGRNGRILFNGEDISVAYETVRVQEWFLINVPAHRQEYHVFNIGSERIVRGSQPSATGTRFVANATTGTDGQAQQRFLAQSERPAHAS